VSPEEALGRLALELEGTSAYTDLVVPLMRPIARLAQLEKVAELARQVAAMTDGPFDYLADCQLLELALTELDNHPETKE
jgi:hypothetical protein